MVQIIDGKIVSKLVKDNIKSIIESKKINPSLAVILVGNDPASLTYVRNKTKECLEVGISPKDYHLPEDTPEEKLLELIGNFHPENVGKLMIGTPFVEPCTPKGVIRLLEHYGISVEGKRAVVLGRSNIVGKPMAIMLLHRNATVTICHSKTKDLSEITKQADILVSAIGIPNFVKADMIKKDAVVIDVGINKVEENGKSKLVGDVDFENVKEVASYITPVPGGVGPMTRAMLLENTVNLALYRRSC